MAGKAKGHRGRHAGTVEELPSGHYRGRVRVVYPDGTHKRLSTKALRTKREAQEAMTQMQQDALKGVRPVASRYTVGEMVTEHMAAKSSTWADRTLWNNQALYRRHISLALGEKHAAGVTPRDLRLYFTALTAAGLAHSGQHQIHSLLSGAYKRAIADGLLRDNPAQHARPLTASKGGAASTQKVRHFTPEELGRFIDAALLERGGLVLAFLAYTGMRIGEALALTWGDWREDPDTPGASSVSISKTRSEFEGTYYTGKTKTAKSTRVIPLSPDAHAIVEDMRRRVKLEARAEHYVGAKVGKDEHERTVRGTHRDAPIFAAVDGRFTRQDVVRGVMDRVCEAAGVPVLFPHALRHSAGTYWIAAGHDPVSVAAIMGHAQVTTTMNTYAHALPDKLRGLAIERASLPPAKAKAAPDPIEE